MQAANPTLHYFSIKFRESTYLHSIPIFLSKSLQLLLINLLLLEYINCEDLPILMGHALKFASPLGLG